jgi:hypothetical protein
VPRQPLQVHGVYRGQVFMRNRPKGQNNESTGLLLRRRGLGDENA